MSTHDEYMTRRQARDLARRLARLERKTRSTAAAHADLRHSALDQGARIPIKDEQGNTTAYVGSGPTGIEHVDGPVPEQPSAPFVDVGPRVVKVQSSGLDVNENPAPADLKHVEVHVAQDEVFEPSWSTFATNMDTANGSVTHSLPAGEWYVGLVWVTLSGKRSVMSEIVLAVIEPPVDVQDIQDTLDAAESMLDEYRDEVAAPRFQALEEGFVVHETNISDARDRLEAAESTLAPLPGRITEAETKVEDAREAAESAEARAVEASNNASNRLTNGGFELGLDHWDTTNVTLSNDAHTGTQAALIGVGGSLVPDASIPVSEGDVWDVSAYAKNGSALVVDVINSADNTVLESFTTSTASSWSETGRLRVEVPAGVSYVNIRITGDGVLVDDVVLRDVTDVVRLERAATAARQTADQALAELELMRLAVDGEGGLKDRLTSAETVLETKADTSRLNELDGKLAELGTHFTKIWRQPTPPPTGITYEWDDGAHVSASVKRVNGVEVARNRVPNPSFEVSSNIDYVTTSVVTHSRTRIGATQGEWAQGLTVHTVPGSFFYLYQILPVDGQQWAALKIGNITALLPNRGRAASISLRFGARVNGAITYSSIQRVTIDGLENTLARSYRIPAGATELWAMVYSYGDADTSSHAVGDVYRHDAWHLDFAATEQDALDRVATYFDGDSPDDRENDLWYNQAGVPHFWLKGWGWAVLEDQRLDNLGQLLEDAQDDLQEALEGPIDHARLRVGEGAFDEAFASKLIADHATIINAAMRNLSVEEKLLFAEAIGEQVWAELGVFDRLEAREGWIGGTMLEDGVVVTKVLEATEQIITHMFASNYALIEEKLVVENEFIANNATIINAALQTLSVTEMANFVTAFADELFADEFTARSAVLARAIVAAPNLYPALDAPDMPEALNLTSAAEWVDNTHSSTGKALRFTPGSGNQSARGPIFDIEPGQEIHLQAKYGRVGNTRAEGGVWYLGIYRLDDDGNITGYGPYVASDRTGAADWDTEISGTVTVREDETATKAQVLIRFDDANGTILDGAHTTVYDIQARNKLDGRLLVDGTVTTRHLEVTESMVGAFAEFLHLVVDRIDVNSLWADQTWQAAGHFGSEDADQKTEVDGTGVTLYRKIDGEFIPAAVFGGGDLQLVFIDDQGNPTGTLTRDGHMSGVESNFQNYVWRGRPLFGRSLQEENIPVIDSLTHKFVARNRRVMDASDGANQEHYGFLPLTFHAVAGMTYEIIVPSIRMWNIGEAGIVFAQIHYTTDGRPPVLSDPILGGETTATTANVGTQKIIQHFSRFYDAEEDGEVNLLLAVRTEIGAEVARWWHSASSEASVAEMLVRPAGATAPITGGTRDVTPGNPDLGSGEQYYQTGWTPTWHQAYINTTRYTGTATHMLAGTNGPDIRYSTHFGGYRNSAGYGGSISDAGQTMQQALGGAFISNGTLTLTGAPNPTSSGGRVWVQWHTHTSAPTTFTSDYPARLIQSVEITAGQQSVIDLPRAVLDAIAAGTFQGFTVHHPTADVPYVSIRSAESTDLITNQPIMRLGYVR